MELKLYEAIMKLLYERIYPKNFICYTATVQLAMFWNDLDLRQAGLGLSVALFPGSPR